VVVAVLLVASAVAVVVGMREQNPTATTIPTTEPQPLAWRNPVIASDFPDPEVLRVNGSYVAFATNGPGGRIQVSSSRDLSQWTPPAEALGAMPGWASPNRERIWAPAVQQFGDRWVLYATFQDARSGRQCIGAAVASRVTGPYEPSGGVPLVCPVQDGGAIDPDVLVDGGQPWLLWKVDGNCCGRPSVIRSQPLGPDGLVLTGQPTTILSLDQSWEKGQTAAQSTIEGPSMTRINDKLVLLYSGGPFAGGAYATGAALCDSPGGPCVKTSSVPLMASGPALAGPGGASFFADDRGRPWVAYHAWDPARVGYAAGGIRSMRIDPVVLVDDRLVVLGPTASPMELESKGAVPVPAPSTTTAPPRPERP